MYNDPLVQKSKVSIAHSGNDPTAITNPIGHPHLEDANRHLKGDAMQTENMVGDTKIASLLFAHVDPSTGKFTDWTFALSESSLSVPRPLHKGGGRENVVTLES